MLDVSHHVSFLIETHVTIWKWAGIRFVICVDALMWEELVQTSEYFHAWAFVGFSLFSNWSKQIMRKFWKLITGDHWMNNRKRIRNLPLSPLRFRFLSWVPYPFIVCSFHSWAMALEEAEGFEALVLLNMEYDKIIAIWHVHLLIVSCGRVKHVKISVSLFGNFVALFANMVTVFILNIFLELLPQNIVHCFIFFAALYGHEPTLFDLMFVHEIIW